MFGNILFFLLAFVTVSALIWCGLQLMQDQEDPLGDRLEALQNASAGSGHRPSQRRKGKGFRNSFLYAVGSIPGADDWLKENEKRLRQAGMKSPNALAYYTM